MGWGGMGDEWLVDKKSDGLVLCTLLLCDD